MVISTFATIDWAKKGVNAKILFQWNFKGVCFLASSSVIVSKSTIKGEIETEAASFTRLQLWNRRLKYI